MSIPECTHEGYIEAVEVAQLLIKQKAAVIAELRPWLRHYADCWFITHGGRHACTCGLSAILGEGEKE